MDPQISDSDTSKSDGDITKDSFSILVKKFGDIQWSSAMVMGAHNRCSFEVNLKVHNKRFVANGASVQSAKKKASMAALRAISHGADKSLAFNRSIEIDVLYQGVGSKDIENQAIHTQSISKDSDKRTETSSIITSTIPLLNVKATNDCLTGGGSNADMEKCTSAELCKVVEDSKESHKSIAVVNQIGTKGTSAELCKVAEDSKESHKSIAVVNQIGTTENTENLDFTMIPQPDKELTTNDTNDKLPLNADSEEISLECKVEEYILSDGSNINHILNVATDTIHILDDISKDNEESLVVKSSDFYTTNIVLENPIENQSKSVMPAIASDINKELENMENTTTTHQEVNMRCASTFAEGNSEKYRQNNDTIPMRKVNCVPNPFVKKKNIKNTDNLSTPAMISTELQQVLGKAVDIDLELPTTSQRAKKNLRLKRVIDCCHEIPKKKHNTVTTCTEFQDLRADCNNVQNVDNDEDTDTAMDGGCTLTTEENNEKYFAATLAPKNTSIPLDFLEQQNDSTTLIEKCREQQLKNVPVVIDISNDVPPNDEVNVPHNLHNVDMLERETAEKPIEIDPPRDEQEDNLGTCVPNPFARNNENDENEQNYGTCVPNPYAKKTDHKYVENPAAAMKKSIGKVVENVNQEITTAVDQIQTHTSDLQTINPHSCIASPIKRNRIGTLRVNTAARTSSPEVIQIDEFPSICTETDTTLISIPSPEVIHIQEIPTEDINMSSSTRIPPPEVVNVSDLNQESSDIFETNEDTDIVNAHQEFVPNPFAMKRNTVNDANCGSPKKKLTKTSASCPFTIIDSTKYHTTVVVDLSEDDLNQVKQLQNTSYKLSEDNHIDLTSAVIEVDGDTNAMEDNNHNISSYSKINDDETGNNNVNQESTINQCLSILLDDHDSDSEGEETNEENDDITIIKEISPESINGDAEMVGNQTNHSHEKCTSMVGPLNKRKMRSKILERNSITFGDDELEVPPPPNISQSKRPLTISKTPKKLRPKIKLKSPHWKPRFQPYRQKYLRQRIAAHKKKRNTYKIPANKFHTAGNSIQRLNQICPTIDYVLESEMGPTHSPFYMISATLNGRKYYGHGKTQNLARLDAAKQILDTFHKGLPKIALANNLHSEELATNDNANNNQGIQIIDTSPHVVESLDVTSPNNQIEGPELNENLDNHFQFHRNNCNTWNNISTAQNPRNREANQDLLSHSNKQNYNQKPNNSESHRTSVRNSDLRHTRESNNNQNVNIKPGVYVSPLPTRPERVTCGGGVSKNVQFIGQNSNDGDGHNSFLQTRRILFSTPNVNKHNVKVWDTPPMLQGYERSRNVMPEFWQSHTRRSRYSTSANFRAFQTNLLRPSRNFSKTHPYNRRVSFNEATSQSSQHRKFPTLEQLLDADRQGNRFDRQGNSFDRQSMGFNRHDNEDYAQSSHHPKFRTLEQLLDREANHTFNVSARRGQSRNVDQFSEDQLNNSGNSRTFSWPSFPTFNDSMITSQRPDQAIYDRDFPTQQSGQQVTNNQPEINARTDQYEFPQFPRYQFNFTESANNISGNQQNPFNKDDNKDKDEDNNIDATSSCGEYNQSFEVLSNSQMQLQRSLHLNQEHANLVEKLVLDHFDSLTSSKPEVRDYKVLAGIVMTRYFNFENAKVIAVATGTKCINGGNISCEGTVVNDSHAEVIARRCLVKYLYTQLKYHTVPDLVDNSIFIRNPTGLQYAFSLSPQIQFHLYISTAPCGDARVFSSNHDYADSHDSQHGQLRTKVEDGMGTQRIGNQYYQQTCDGIQLGEPLFTMSCSDKIARWNVLGVQGALLATLVEPIYLSSLVLGSMFNSRHLYRAVCGRLEQTLNFLPKPYRLNRPLLGQASVTQKRRSTQRTPNIGINWTYGDPEIEVISLQSGREINNTLSFLCKKVFFEKYICLLRLLPNVNFAPTNNYAQAKENAHDFQIAKQELFDAFQHGELGCWIKKPTEQNEFTTNI